MDDDLLAGLGQLRGEDLGAQHRVAARAVGDGQGGEPPVRAELGRQRPDAGSGVVAEHAAPWDQLGNVREAACVAQVAGES